MTVDIEHLRSWMGRTETAHDVVTAAPLRALSATLDRDDAPQTVGDPVPTCWHWLYFLPMHRQSHIGPDGHAMRGGFLPPVPLPRRMWAGSEIAVQRSITVGQNIVRHSRIEDVRMKEGRTGSLVFVRVLHEVLAEGQLAISERQDIVYRDMPQVGEPARGGTPARGGMPAPDDATWARQIDPDSALLFRYSALTFNGHRIHHDRPYAIAVEGYPGLVVHGPLIATLMLDLLRRQMPQARLEHFEFRALKPIFDTAPFEVCGRVEGARQIRLWARTHEGHSAMDARVTLA
jgi:3-methylfumaryl-CoA hydratase